MRTSTMEAPKPTRDARDLRRKTLDDLAAAAAGTLVYTDTPGGAKLRAELEQRLRARGLALRDVGAYHVEIVAPQTLAAPKTAACRFCNGAVWCGKCRRCGTAV